MFTGKAGQIEVGRPAPAIELTRLLQAPPDARTDWAALEGHVVVLEFWATWCGPCITSIPHLNELAEKFEGRPVRFISITEEEETVVRSFLEKRSMRSWIGLDGAGTTTGKYSPRTAMPLPATFVVDKTGTVAAITTPTSLTERMIDDLLEDRAAPAAPLFDVRIQRSIAESGYSTQALGNLSAQRVDLEWLVATAYGVRHAQIVDEAGMGDELYDVVVSTPRGRQLMQPLLQTAIEATFDIKARREVREVDAYELGRIGSGYGPNFQPTTADPNAPSVSDAGQNWRSAANRPVGALAAVLEMLLKQPVRDGTGLDGSFDWKLTFAERTPAAIAVAVREQLGFALTPIRMEREFLVVERSGR